MTTSSTACSMGMTSREWKIMAKMMRFLRASMTGRANSDD